jgi:hypothetical protein
MYVSPTSAIATNRSVAEADGGAGDANDASALQPIASDPTE